MSFLLFHLHMKKDKKIRCEYYKLTYDSDTPPKGGGVSLSTVRCQRLPALANFTGIFFNFSIAIE